MGASHELPPKVALDPLAAGAGTDAALDVTFGQFVSRQRGYDHYVRLCAGTCRVLEVASGVIGVPTDHLLVAAIAAAFGQTARIGEVKLSLIAQMRDGPGEGQVVANLASARHLSLWIGGGRSLLSLALHLSARLRQRQWGLSDLVNQDCDGVFINVRGLPGFDGARPVIEPVDVTRRATKFVKNAVEMCADQEKPDQWTIWMGARIEFDGARFAREMRRAIWGFAVDPLQSFCTDVSADTLPVWAAV
ncbi:unnamed protein product [Prorocentrum cordatum]|uniref:Uncharacterized protein n=1 Tax=Prorocentrum cordatum TaxID=2364126 RepID=A0ABN9S0A1_9DINO|nr:unnamed protein product [Polarella glacialis]